MPKFVIERDIPGIGASAPADLRAIAARSGRVLNELGPEIRWLESFLTGDKTYCIYIAPSEELIREHARRAGFPADRISEVKAVIDPSTAGSC